MSNVAETPTAAKAMTGTGATALRALWSGWAASVPVVLLAALAVLATPHVRGIGFFPALRYAVVAPACVLVAPACVLVAVASAFLYRALAGRPGRPRATLAAVLVGLAVIASSCR